MKVTGVTTDSNETSASIDLFEGRKLPRRVKERVIEDVGNFLVEQANISVAQKKSPVSGHSGFKALSPLYKKKKLEEVGSSEANLEFTGQMLDELDFRPTKDGLRFGVFGERAKAADGHNNLSGESALPTRRFIPNVGENFKAPIAKEVERIIADVIAEETEIDPDDFEGVSTKAALYRVLGKYLGELTRTETALAVFRNEKLYETLRDKNLLGLL